MRVWRAVRFDAGSGGGGVLCPVELVGDFGRQERVFLAKGLRFCSGVDDDLRIDSHVFVFGSIGGNAEGGKVWSEDGDECGSEGPAEGSADGKGTIIGHPVACGS